MHMRFFTSNTNEAKFCTHVDSCVGISVGNIQQHQWIITTNLYIVKSYIQFDGENHFDPIHLNFALVKGILPALVT